MAHSITVKLNKPAREFQAGESIGFNVRAGVQYYDRQSKKKEWTNYSAAVFARPGPQADYYRSVLVEGSIVELTGDSIKVDVYQGNNGQTITLELQNAKVGFASSGHHHSSQTTLGSEQFDDSIPF
ncbi:hypothetical protein SMZ82_002381 [Cronobacter malonaticus]|uniref:hypothetical protein n=1 Tax=Cronobacter sakazakii TaxID=28141 RepID=UPI000A195BC8|nr:hypothetical protein [Cronobacter sakazakii]ELY4583065.1 hypothetical protein [Cronobacter malonaticus]EGZ6857668.1 hypothetical protein [Cronobacter sakazakii]EGZ6870470.1 hypothetical protein [Cronobacter sakazakii]ELY3444910.1 hypothetical protein [Cronobacter sakazakii]ELY6206699.1 hypothetical protein [Cronobacter sakazakii]